MKLKILCIGYVVGSPGCNMLQKHLPIIKEKYGIHATIVNGENCSDGRGITPKNMQFFKHLKVDVVTSGNHIWDKKEIYSYLDQNEDLLRPANFPSETPGVGVTIFEYQGIAIAVINIQGRVFMKEDLDCPFKTVDSILTYVQDKTKVILVDFHAETTSEKTGMGFYLDGRVSAVFGTHTHIQTSDDRILPNGTAYITDLGMVGALNSMLGMKKDNIIQHFLTQMPTRFMVETEGPMLLNGIVVEIDSDTGAALSIERIRIVDDLISTPE
jgi:metallophosphoesterase (TIGR00282 family)